ncbi:MAG: hypothetical protein Kow0020_01300 [Wenzhouxiangellaceae bacterium]
MDEFELWPRKLLTIVTESALEQALCRDLDRLGATGYTVTNARGKGRHGRRDAGWDTDANIRVEVVCDEAVAKRIMVELRRRYYANYAMIMLLSDVQVLRPEKF